MKHAEEYDVIKVCGWFFLCFTLLTLSGLSSAHAVECKNISPYQAYQKADLQGFLFKCKGAFQAHVEGGIGCFFTPEKKGAHSAEFFIDETDHNNAKNGQLRNGWRIKAFDLDCRLVFKNGQWIKPKGFANCRKDSQRVHSSIGKTKGPRLVFKTKVLRLEDKKAKHWDYRVTSLTFEKKGGQCHQVLKEAFGD